MLLLMIRHLLIIGSESIWREDTDVLMMMSVVQL